MSTLNVIQHVEVIDGAPVEAPGSPVERAVRILEAVIRRWPSQAWETREIRTAIALLAPEMRAAHDGENANDSDLARAACDGEQL